MELEGGGECSVRWETGIEGEGGRATRIEKEY